MLIVLEQAELPLHCFSGVTESLFAGGGGGKPSSGGGGARGRHRNEGCTIQKMGVPWCEWGGGGMSPP